MTEPLRSIESNQGKLRRIALAQQGLLKNNSFGRGKQGTLRAIEHLGYLQIDTISVVERAHHHVLRTRVSNYQAQFLQQLVGERKVFEYWAHAAAWLPMRDFRFSLPRMAQANGERNWFAQSDRQLMSTVLTRIEAEGPMRARDFEANPVKSQGWWDWKPSKQALEQLFMQGELMVSRRDGFEKLYDLPERVLPNGVDTRYPEIDEFANYLITTNLRAHGCVGLKSFSYLRKGKKLRDSIVDQVSSLVTDGELCRVKLNNQNSVFIRPDRLQSQAPRSRAKVSILSPFDNAVIQRDRVQQLFDFNYQIECYLPEAKRQFGYFCLPILYRDQLVGRIDCKAHRKQQRLEVKSFHIERPVDQGFDEALKLALIDYAVFNQCCQLDTRAAKGTVAQLSAATGTNGLICW